MALSGLIKIAYALLDEKALDLGGASFPVNKSYDWKVANGVGAAQADKLFTDQRSIAASANEDLDLNAGGLTDVYGAVFTIARLKALVVKAAVANPGTLTIGRGATNGVPWLSAVSSGVILRPGGVFGWVADEATGIVVTAGTGDLINFLAAATSGTYTYDVAIVGASA